MSLVLQKYGDIGLVLTLYYHSPACRPYIFTGVHCLDVHIPLNFSSTSDDPDDCDEPTEITFIGLKGEVEKRSREAVHCVYESRPVPKDHQVPGDEQRGAMNFGT